MTTASKIRQFENAVGLLVSGVLYDTEEPEGEVLAQLRDALTRIRKKLNEQIDEVKYGNPEGRHTDT